MLSDKLLSELNEQIKHEFYSAHYYLAMAAYCAAEDFKGFAHFFMVQAEEENFHAMKFFNFINGLGARVKMTGFANPPNEYESLENVIALALKHEHFVTARIYKLMDMAVEEKEHATISFLKWFIDEQVEEEGMMNDVLRKIKRIGEKGEAIYHLDNELSQRVFTPPVA